jgi:hypothetical protein
MFGRRRAQCGETALMCAAENGRTDCARLLLDAGADKEAKQIVRAIVCVGGAGALVCWGIYCWDMVGVGRHVISISVFNFHV